VWDARPYKHLRLPEKTHCREGIPSGCCQTFTVEQIVKLQRNHEWRGKVEELVEKVVKAIEDVTLTDEARERVVNTAGRALTEMGADPQKDLPWMGPEVLASLDVINAHLFLGNAAPGSEGEQDLFSQFVKIHKRPAARNEFVRKMGCFQRYLVSIDEHREFEWDADKLQAGELAFWQ